MTCYNLVFGDKFSFIWITWMSHIVFFPWSIWNLHHPWREKGRLSKSQWRIKKVGHSLTHYVELIRRLLSSGILCSKHSKPKSFMFCFNMIQVQILVKEFTRIFQSLGYIRHQLRFQFYPVRIWFSGWLGGLIMRVEPFSTLRENMYVVTKPMY